MSWNVTCKRKLERNLNKLPMEVQALFQVLIQDLKITGVHLGKIDTKL